ncbi:MULTISPECIES: histone deacetylase family protein [Thalassospira]|uniref:Acetoin utilization protein n=1 Tax=Thalassospira profundimaris TaxID=502049 RepID=A0A367WT41_9PROT|nr:histone deacetylase family protein [Thalassospira profundimaris]RCK44624.1 acetoin utilization protein [Thalassospira profundimaris]
MATLFVTHHDCIEHDTGPGHPESSDRLRVIQRVFEAEEFMFLHREEAPLGDMDLIKAVHDPAYVDKVMASIPESGIKSLDGDTYISPKSGKAALRAVGGACVAVDAVVDGHEHNAFVATRPPGHHAEYDRAMGFCLFNNAAIAAHYARKRYGLKRIAVMDFDVHHGNGTQDLFFNDPDLFYCSTHQWPLYPGTGAETERGCANNILNVGLPAGAGTAELQAAFNETVIPGISAFKPELLIVSAGFDAHKNDPLAGLCFETDDFVWITRQLMALADAQCEGRLVSLLEGGYDLPSLAESVLQHVRTLMTG